MSSSVCIDCMKCITVPKTKITKCRCSADLPGFKGILDIHHPFITINRNCPMFDPDEPMENGQK